jgi:hypothetical protein
MCNCKKNIRQAPQVIIPTPEPIQIVQMPEVNDGNATVQEDKQEN